MGNRFSVGALTLALLSASLAGGASAEAATAPTLGSAAAILVDVADGRVLFERSADEKRAIASTTKILTALVVLETSDLSDIVQASTRAEQVGADDPLVTELELVAGERLSVQDLLYGLLLRSANDAAVALAEHVAGSQTAFAKLMTERARKAGARQSRFVNPHGFDHPDHYSTARDLALITLQAWRIPEFKKIVATQQYEIPWAGHPTPRKLVNRNQLLSGFPGANGVKTGQTKASGRSLVASATRQSESRIAVVLSSPDPFADSRALLDFGFNQFRRVDVLTHKVTWGFVTTGTGKSLAVLPSRTVSVLVESGSPPPLPRFLPKQKSLIVEIPGSSPKTVPASLSCVHPCSSVKPNPLQGILSALTSVIGWF